LMKNVFFLPTKWKISPDRVPNCVKWTFYIFSDNLGHNILDIGDFMAKLSYTTSK